MLDYLNMYFDNYSELRTIAIEEDNILTRKMLNSLDDEELEMAYDDAKYEIKADTQFNGGGGVGSKAEKLANTIRKDYQNGVVVQVYNDYGDSAYFSISAPFEYSLSKERAKEINKKYFNGKGEISGGGNEHYLNVNFDLDNFGNGGGGVGMKYEVKRKGDKHFNKIGTAKGGIEKDKRGVSFVTLHFSNGGVNSYSMSEVNRVFNVGGGVEEKEDYFFDEDDYENN